MGGFFFFYLATYVAIRYRVTHVAGPEKRRAKPCQRDDKRLS